MTTSIPIFPLHTVLYPGTLLPLKIFEQRYLEMTKACVRDNAPFGVSRIREGREVGVPAVPEQVGCSAVILEWEIPHLGVFHLRTHGQTPFRIIQQSTQADGLIRADVEWLAENTGEVRPESHALCRRVLEQIVEKLGVEYFSPPLAYDDSRWISYRLAEVLPLQEEEKQRLLAVRNDGERLDRLHALLRRTA
jgi:Lon protease-like protein